jgi:hypothetical protein
MVYGMFEQLGYTAMRTLRLDGDCQLSLSIDGHFATFNKPINYETFLAVFIKVDGSCLNFFDRSCITLGKRTFFAKNLRNLGGGTFSGGGSTCPLVPPLATPLLQGPGRLKQWLYSTAISENMVH